MDLSVDYIKMICNYGGEVYVVGGAVRNFLYNYFHKTNIKIKDYDYLVRLVNKTDLTNILQKVGIVKEVGMSFGIVLFKPFGLNEHFEFAIPRTEISTGSGYKDFLITSNHTLSIETDFSRRDATINAIAFRVFSIKDLELIDFEKTKTFEKERIIDPYNGIDDILNKVWRCVGDPSKRFSEDPGRIMRAFRQSAELNLTIENHTMISIEKNYSLMSELIPNSYVRLYNEFFCMLSTSNFEYNLRVMHSFGILDFLGLKDVKLKINVELPLILKFATLIKVERINGCVKKWCNDKRISSTNFISSKDINLLVATNKVFMDIILCCSKYEMLKIIEKVYKLFNIECYQIINSIIKYAVSNQEISSLKADKILSYLELAKSYPPSINQIILKGNVLISRWNIKGNQIKIVKEYILDKIFRDTIENKLECLEKMIDIYVLNNNF
jgi:tRNA nucleotidyltransferase/poly(A) polymerase